VRSVQESTADQHDFGRAERRVLDAFRGAEKPMSLRHNAMAGLQFDWGLVNVMLACSLSTQAAEVKALVSTPL